MIFVPGTVLRFIITLYFAYLEECLFDTQITNFEAEYLALLRIR